MANTTRFEEKIMVEAVQKYYALHKGKIILRELAKWADEEIQELKGVHDYDFSRKSERKNKKTGELVIEERPCFKLIKEINEKEKENDELKKECEKLNERFDGKNIILRGKRIDSFFNLDPSVQRQLLRNTREEYEKIQIENIKLKETCDMLRNSFQSLFSAMNEYKNKYAETEENVRFLIDRYREIKMNEKIDGYGIDDCKMNLEQLKNALSKQKDCYAIDLKISKYLSTYPNDDSFTNDCATNNPIDDTAQRLNEAFEQEDEDGQK